MKWESRSDHVRVNEEREREWVSRSWNALRRFSFFTSISFIAADIAFIVVIFFISALLFGGREEGREERLIMAIV